jgi:hypothetical protein
MQDCVTAYTTNYSINNLKNVFETRLMSYRLWPSRSPDLNPYYSHLWGNLESKGYPNNPHTMDELKYICEAICRGHSTNVKQSFPETSVLSRAEGRHLKHLL